MTVPNWRPGEWASKGVAAIATRTHNVEAFAFDSRQLEELRTQDFSSVKAEIAEIFSEDPPPTVPVNLVDRVCKEVAELYVRAPRRQFTTPAPGVVELLERIGWNLVMQGAAEQSVAQNAVILSVDPGRMLGRPLVQTWLPYQVRVHFNDPTRVAAPIHEADRVEIQVPIQVHHEDAHATVYYGRRVYTPQEAYLETPEGKRIPLIGADVRHGLGYVPLAGLRRATHREGLWLPSLPYDILCVAVATAMGISDWHHIARYSLYSQEHWWGREAGRVANEAPTGPRFVAGWEVGEPGDLQHELVERNPPLDKYVTIIEKTLELFASNRSVSRTSLSESSGITGDAKAEERADQERERLRMEQLCARFENDALRVLVDVLRVAGEPTFAAPMVPTVTLDYHYVRPRGNALQEAQAAAVLISQDRTSPEELVERDEGVSPEEAEDRVMRRRLKRLAQLPAAGDSVDGLDRIDPA